MVSHPELFSDQSGVWTNVPQPVQQFYSECKYILTYATKRNLSLWWTLRQFVKSFVETRSARLLTVKLWPIIHEAKEIYLDRLCLANYPLSFFVGFLLGTTSKPITIPYDANNAQYNYQSNNNQRADPFSMIKEILSSIRRFAQTASTWKLTRSSNELKFDDPHWSSTFFQAAVTISMEILIPVLIFSLFPTLFSESTVTLNETPTGFWKGITKAFSFLKDYQFQLVLLSNCFTGFQGYCSAKRCLSKITQSDQSVRKMTQLSQQQRNNLKTLLSISPVPVKETSINKILESVPLVTQAAVAYSHVYVIGVHRGAFVNSGLFCCSALAWMQYHFQQAQHHEQ